MKNHPPAAVAPLSHRRSRIPAVVYVLLLFSVGYSLGFLAASSSRMSYSSPSPSATPVSLETQISENKTEKTTQNHPKLLNPQPQSNDFFRFRTKCADPVPQFDVLKVIMENIYDGMSTYEGFPSPATEELLLPPAARPRGWGSTGKVFHDLITTVRPLVIVELGTFLGASALHMADIAANLSIPSTILCIDDFRGWPGIRRQFWRDLPAPHQGDALLLHQFMAGVMAAKEEEERRVVPLPFSTSAALAALCEWGVYADLIEVDAGHDFHSAWADINMAYAVLRPGGVMFGHDYFTKADDSGVRRAVTLFAKVKGLQPRPNGQHWVLSPKPAAGH